MIGLTHALSKKGMAGTNEKNTRVLREDRSAMITSTRKCQLTAVSYWRVYIQTKHVTLTEQLSHGVSQFVEHCAGRKAFHILRGGFNDSADGVEHNGNNQQFHTTKDIGDLGTGRLSGRANDRANDRDGGGQSVGAKCTGCDQLIIVAELLKHQRSYH